MSKINDNDFDACVDINEVLKTLSDEDFVEVCEKYFDENFGKGSFWESDFFGNLALVKEDLLDKNGIFKDYTEKEIKEIINNEESSYNPKDKWLLLEETMLSDGREISYVETYPTVYDAVLSKSASDCYLNNFLSKKDYKDNADGYHLVESIVYEGNDYGNKKIRECLDNFTKEKKGRDK